MRGDRPDSIERFFGVDPFTPHARGSTQVKEFLTMTEKVYPACAGIDPMGVLQDRLVVGLPRMRGDRPEQEGSGARN